MNSDLKAMDGIFFQQWHNRHMEATWKGGVTTVVTSPQGTNLVGGVGVAFFTHGTVIDDALIKSSTSLHVHLGNAAKDGSSAAGSVSAQIGTLRAILQANNSESISAVLSGQIPLVAHVDQADEISSILRLKEEFGFNLVIIGGAEAHILAAQLGAANVSVVLAPARAHPLTFESWRADTHSATILRAANVSVALAELDPSWPRNLRWEAGYAVSEGLGYMDALAAITKIPAQMFGLYSSGVGSVINGQKANFVAFTGDPLSLESNVALVVLGGYVDCTPQQY